MKKLHKLSTLFLVLVIWVTAAISVSAATQVKDGLDITVQTDKQKYETDEKITAWITVKNTNSFGVGNVSLECAIPAGYQAEGNSILTIPDLASWEQQTLTVVLSPKAGSIPATGDDSNVLLWSLAVVFAVVALVLVCLKLRKNRGSVLAMFLCAAMVLTSLPMGDLKVQAAEATETVTVQETVEVGSEKLVIEGKVTYNAFVTEEDTGNSGSEPGVEEPSGEEPSVDDPSEEDPGVDESSGEEPGVDEPSGGEPGVDEPSGEEPGVNEPGVDDPSGEVPGGDEPGGEEPGGDVSSGDVSGGDGGDVSGGDPSDDDTSDDPIMVYVSPNGDDTNPGTLERPVKTLEGARDLVRELKAVRTVAVPVTVYLRAGNYALSQTFALTAEDGGTAEAPVTWRAYQNEEVIISGGSPYSFSHFVPVTGEMKDKLPTQAAKDNVMVANASDLGLSPIDVQPLYDGTALGTPLMMLDDHHLNLTRYPNAEIDTEHIQSTIKIGQGSAVTLNIDDDTFWSWDYNTDDFVYGGRYRYGYEQVYMNGARDTANKTVTSTHTVSGGSSIGTKPTQVFNAYQSMDEPGEWYYDAITDKLYIYPYADTDENSDLYITESSIVLITITEADHISLEGLTLTSSNQGVVVSNSDYCVINNCELLSFQGRALDMTGVTHSGIKNSVVAYSHNTAVRIEGGDQVNLISGNNFISNNSIHDLMLYYSRNVRAVNVRGVGTRVDHNDFYNISDAVVGYSNPGNADKNNSIDTVIEYNTFHDCLHNATDMGIVYGVGTMRTQGLVVRNNHFYNYGKNTKNLGHTGRAVYADESTSGVSVYNNIFGPGASGVATDAMNNNCGHDNKFYNNLLIDLPHMIIVTAVDSLHDRIMNDTGLKESLEAAWENPAYTSRWPWMQAAHDGETDYFIPIEASNNVMIFTDTVMKDDWPDPDDNGKYYKLHQSAQLDTHLKLDGNLIINKDDYADTRDLFVDYENGDYRLVDSVLAQTEFENIDQSQMGLQTFTYDGAEYLPGGNTPVVSDVAFTVTEAEVGNTVEVTYQLSNAVAGEGTVVEFYTGDSQDDKFYLNWKLVSNENRKDDSYYVTSECAGKWLKCKVTPMVSNGAMGTAVWSEAIYVKDEEASIETRTITLNNMLLDTENWKINTATESQPVFSDDSLSLTSTSNKWGVTYYDGDKFKNTIFSFKYTQNFEDPQWGGFFLKMDDPSTEMPYWPDTVAVIIKETQIELQMRGITNTEKIETVPNTYFESGKTYDVTFGMYDINATEVRIILTVDGTEVFNVVTNDPAFHSAESYFGAWVNSGGHSVKFGGVYEINEIDINTLIADADNWALAGGNTVEPIVETQSITIVNPDKTYAAAYYTEGFKNTVFHFQYQQTGFASGFYLKMDNLATEMPYWPETVLVWINEGQVELQLRGTDNTNNQINVTNTNIIENGKVHDIVFGFYDISDTQVRVILTIDGNEIFNEITDDVAFRSAEAYLGFFTTKEHAVKLINVPVVNEVAVSAMIADTENWKVGGNTSAAKANKVSAVGFLNSGSRIKLTPAWLGGWGWYAGDTYKNTEFSFKYEQSDFRYKRSGYVGFTLEQPSEGTTVDAATPPISSTGILQNSAADGIYVQFGLNQSFSTTPSLQDAKQYSQIDLIQVKDGVKTILDSSVGEVALANTEVYDVTFGLYDISETEARIVVSVDDVEIFNTVTTEESFLSAEGYFGMAIAGQVLLYIE